MFVKIDLHPHIKNQTPVVGKDVFIADNSRLIGDVTVEDRVSIWFQVAIRGDVMPIRIGEESNIQDGTVIHASEGQTQTIIGKRVTVGHMCLLHGCTIGDLCLIGMGSILMDHVTIPEKCIVGAGSLVTSSKGFEPHSLILGRPAKKVRDLTEKEIRFLDTSADNYLRYKSWYKQQESE